MRITVVLEGIRAGLGSAMSAGGRSITARTKLETGLALAGAKVFVLEFCASPESGFGFAELSVAAGNSLGLHAGIFSDIRPEELSSITPSWQGVAEIPDFAMKRQFPAAQSGAQTGATRIARAAAAASNVARKFRFAAIRTNLVIQPLRYAAANEPSTITRLGVDAFFGELALTPSHFIGLKPGRAVTICGADPYARHKRTANNFRFTSFRVAVRISHLPRLRHRLVHP